MRYELDTTRLASTRVVSNQVEFGLNLHSRRVGTNIQQGGGVVSTIKFYYVT